MTRAKGCPTARLAVHTIVSGGQTGVDRAGLDVGLQLGLDIGGWVPKGRRAEDGTVPVHYPLREMPSADYPARTEQNVRDSDATLIFCDTTPTGGTALTVKLARKHDKPMRVVRLSDDAENVDPLEVMQWLVQLDVKVLNIAGPRQSEYPAGYARSFDFLRHVLTQS